MAGTLLAQDPGRENRHANAASTRKIAQSQGLRHSDERVGPARATLYVVTTCSGDPFTIEVSGRAAWALDRLLDAGPRGCTPATDPAPRWSGYVHSLRELGVGIETIREAHGEPFPGHHGRYVLRSTVRRVAR